MRALTFAGLLPALLSFGAPTGAAETPADGYGLTALPVAPPTNPAGPFGTLYGVARTLSNGDVVTFDGQTIERVQSDGTPVATLGSLPAVVFPGAFAIDPTETFALVGESSNGDVFRVDLAGGGTSLLANLPFNFDAVFEDATHAVVSFDPTGGFSNTDLVRLDTGTGATELVAQVFGPSGPLSIDPFGNLVYAVQNLAGNPVDVLLWTEAQVAATSGGAFLTETDAFVLATGYPGLFDLVHDQDTGALYGAEIDWTTGANRVLRVQTDASSSPTIAQGAPWNSPATLEFTSATSEALFLPFQPESGGSLRYSTTDFFSFIGRFEVTPARPQVTLSGPGTFGAGSIVYDVTGGPAGGFFHAYVGFSSLWNPAESAYLIPGLPPLISGLDPTTSVFFPTAYPLDAAGAGSTTFINAGGATGSLATQALTFDVLTLDFAFSSVAFL